MDKTIDRDAALLEFSRTLNVEFNDIGLLNQSLCHRSFINESKDLYSGNNERLEFLGDSVLGFIITEYLYKNYPRLDEGSMAKIRSVVVSEDVLSKIAKNLKLYDYILVGKGEELTGGRFKKAILADTLEAFLGAYFLDSNLLKVRDFVLRFMIEEIEAVITDKNGKDYKTLLQEYCQRKYKSCPVYKLKKEEGPEHNKIFIVRVEMNGDIVGEGFGGSKKEAEKMAAKTAYTKYTVLKNTKTKTVHT